MTTAPRKQRTITLTDARPVRIYEDEWPVVASADWHDGNEGIESRANRRRSIKVREHDDGRRIVYGVYSTVWQNERGAAGGSIVPARDGRPDDEATIKAIREVADEVIDDVQLGDECIADLPAEEI